MKSLLLAPAFASFVHADQAAEPSITAIPFPQLVAITQVVDERPIVELQQAPPPFVPVVDKEDDRFEALKGDLEQLSANLKATQQAVENVAKQRDEAREEVRALAKANHDMLNELKAFRAELETARLETHKWKDHAAKMERKANDQALANAALEQFRNELQGAMKDFQVMRGDIEKARGEFADPIERANLKKELAESKAKQERLGDEIEMALIAREKTIQESARTSKELEGKIATLTKEAQGAKELRDELRSANAVKMKALADVEVLRKGLTTTEKARDEAVAQLESAQNGLTALQAEKAAAMEAKAVAIRERDEANAGRDGLQKQVDVALEQLEASKQELTQVAEKAKAAEEGMAIAAGQRDAAQTEIGKVQDRLKSVQQELVTARKQVAEIGEKAKSADEAWKATDQKLADAAGDLEKTKEEVVFLNKAKGGLEELLFKKTAEIRKLKGDLRKVHAMREKPAETPGENGEAEGDERATAQALADD